MTAASSPDLVRATAWSAFEKWGTRAGTLVVFVVLSHFLPPTDFGIVAIAALFIEFLTILVERGVSQSVIQRPHLDDGVLDAAFWLAAVVGVVLTIVTIVAAPLAGMAFGEPGVVGALRWLSAGLLFACLASVPTALLQRQFEFKALAVRRLTAAALAGVAGIVFAVTGQGVASLVVQALVQGGVALVFSWRLVEWRPGRSATWDLAREIGRFTVAITGIEVLTFLSRHGDDVLIGAVLGAKALGYYTVGYRILLYAIELLTATIQAVALPAFARLQHDLPAMRHAFYRATRTSAAIAVPAFAGMAVLAGGIVPLVFGPQWRPSIPVMQALALVGILQSINYFDRSALIAAGATRTELWLTFVATVGNLVAFAVSVPFGIVAVAVGFAVRTYTFWPIRVRALVRVLGVDPVVYLRQFVTPALASAAMAVVVAAAGHTLGATWTDLALLVAIGLAVYVAVTALLDRRLLRELGRMATRLVPMPARRTA